MRDTGSEIGCLLAVAVAVVLSLLGIMDALDNSKVTTQRAGTGWLVTTSSGGVTYVPSSAKWNGEIK